MPGKVSLKIVTLILLVKYLNFLETQDLKGGKDREIRERWGGEEEEERRKEIKKKNYKTNFFVSQYLEIF